MRPRRWTRPTSETTRGGARRGDGGLDGELGRGKRLVAVHRRGDDRGGGEAAEGGEGRDRGSGVEGGGRGGSAGAGGCPGSGGAGEGPTPGRGFGGRVMVEVKKEDEGSRRTEEAGRVRWCRRRRRRGMKRRSGDGRQRRSSSKAMRRTSSDEEKTIRGQRGPEAAVRAECMPMRLRHAHATVSVRLGDLGQVAGRARLFAGRGGRGAIGEQSGRLSRRRKRSEADARVESAGLSAASRCAGGVGVDARAGGEDSPEPVAALRLGCPPPLSIESADRQAALQGSAEHRAIADLPARGREDARPPATADRPAQRAASAAGTPPTP
ncbi:hypothetical protein ACCO45_007601 [Purpureocillium lilacinum]|uniref:Uncharacterized protein n=1 Tax=Purpureocillium lilacinum TaxID=33203 RepID=A0ACC4DNZ8_PURLI